MLDGLALNVAAVDMDPERRRLPPSRVLVEDAAFLEALSPEGSGVHDLFVVHDREALEAFRANLAPGIDAADHAFLERLSANSSFSFDVHDPYAPFPAPAPVLTGRQDATVGYRDAWDMLEILPRATFAVLERAGHGLGT